MGDKVSLPKVKEKDPFFFYSGKIPGLQKEVKHTGKINVISVDQEQITWEISRLILSDIRQGLKRSDKYDEYRWLKKQWLTSFISSPVDLIPIFVFSQYRLVSSVSIPTVRKIFEFIKIASERLSIQNECLILMVVYLERLKRNGVQIHKNNWRPLLYSCLIFAGKLLEDFSATNKEFVEEYKIFSLKNTNLLEQEVAADLQWQFFVSREEYSDYYFQIKQRVKTPFHTLDRRFTNIV